MEIAPEKFKVLIRSMLANYKMLETELLAYKATVHGLKILTEDSTGEIERSLDTFRKSSAVQQVMNDKYDPSLERLLQLTDQAELNQEFLKWIQSWKPEDGQVN